MSKKDCIIVGGGIAGLTAAWELRDRDVLVLEADGRVGGRIKSEPRGPYWVSVGAHMFPGPGSVLGGLVEELGLRTLPIQGDLLGIANRGKVVLGGRAEGYPFRLPMSLGGRASFARTGLRIRRDAAEYNRIARKKPGESASEVRARVMAFHGDHTFAEYLGRLHPDAEEIFHAVTNRISAEPDKVTAGYVIGLFAHVWSDGDAVLGRNLSGGASALPQALAARLGHRVLTGAPVREITWGQGDDGARVRYESKGRSETLEAKSVIVAAQAPHARKMLPALPRSTAEALEAVTYGPFVVAGIVTKETRPMPWDSIYSLLTVDTWFNMLFNHASALRVPGQPREPGGTLMVYGGAGRALGMWNLSDDDIRRRTTADIERLFPEAKGVIDEIRVQRWEYTIPFATPGRHLHQPALERGVDETIFFAGDYMGDWAHMESAALSAVEAAGKVRARLSAAAAA